MNREPDLFDLAQRIADGAAVDWDEAEASFSDAGGRRTLARLRVVEEIAGFHRSFVDELDADPVAPLGLEDRRSRRPTIPESWGDLEIRRELGEGSAGRVFLAWDPKLQREVALKVVRANHPSHAAVAAAAPDASIDLLREARLLARLRHPNVVTVYGAEEIDGWVGITMEPVHGASLAERVRTQGPLGADEASLVGRDLCRALAAVHQAGLAHRDVKAQNVLREAGGRIVLMDFGVGQDVAALEAADSTADIASVERSGLDEIVSASPAKTLAGTPLYLAPEILQGARASAAGDLYALGVLLFHLVTGDFPVRARGLRDLRAAHTEGRRKRLRDLRPDLPEPFVRAIERAVSADPRERFATAGEFEAALGSAMGAAMGAAVGAREDTTSVTSTGVPATSTPLSPRRIWGFAAAATAVAALALIAIFRGFGGAGEYEIRAQLQRVGADGQRAPLLSGDAVQVGEFLALELQGSRALHVYVLSEDARGESYLLFPLPGSSEINPLRGGASHELPGRVAGQPIYWQVSSDGGEERILVVASPEPQEELEREISRLPAPRAESATPVFAELSEPTVRRLRGIGWLGAPAESPGNAGTTTGARPRTSTTSTAPTTSRPTPTGAVDRIRALAHQTETTRGIYLREITLTNSGR